MAKRPFELRNAEPLRLCSKEPKRTQPPFSGAAAAAFLALNELAEPDLIRAVRRMAVAGEGVYSRIKTSEKSHTDQLMETQEAIFGTPASRLHDAWLREVTLRDPGRLPTAIEEALGSNQPAIALTLLRAQASPTPPHMIEPVLRALTQCSFAVEDPEPSELLSLIEKNWIQPFTLAQRICVLQEALQHNNVAVASLFVETLSEIPKIPSSVGSGQTLLELSLAYAAPDSVMFLLDHCPDLAEYLACPQFAWRLSEAYVSCARVSDGYTEEDDQPIVGPELTEATELMRLVNHRLGTGFISEFSLSMAKHLHPDTRLPGGGVISLTAPVRAIIDGLLMELRTPQVASRRPASRL